MSNEQDPSFIKFETCKYRSTSKKIKKKCCGAGTIEGYSCFLKNIFPLSPIRHCLICESFISDR
jgi:hypothetical protein